MSCPNCITSDERAELTHLRERMAKILERSRRYRRNKRALHNKWARDRYAANRTEIRFRRKCNAAGVTPP